MDGTTINWNNDVKSSRIEDMTPDEQQRIRVTKPPDNIKDHTVWTMAARSTINPHNKGHRRWGHLK